MNNKIQLIQSFIIVCLTVSLFLNKCTSREEPLQTKVDTYVNDSTYVKTGETSSLSQLRKENTELYDKIKKTSNLLNATMFNYHVCFITDTVKVPVEINKQDIKTFTETSDTISYELKIKAENIEWYKLKFNIAERFSLINRSDNENTELSIISSQGEINNVTNYVPKKKKNPFRNFVIGPQIGVGVLPNENFKPTYYIGFGITYNILGK